MAVSLCGIAVFFILLVMKGVEAAEWLVMERNFNYQFTDHFRHMILVQDLQGVYSYTTDASLPPLAYLFYRVLFLMDPTQYPMQLNSCFLMEFQEYQLLIFVMYLCLITVLLVMGIKKVIQWQYGDVAFFFLVLSIVLSAAMVSGAYERGNIVLFTLMFLVYALYFKDSENKVKRELALIFIAVAAGFKIYPAIMGLLYLKEKRWKEAARLLVYGILFFFVPFLFTGGIRGMVQYISILQATAEDTALRFTNVGSFVPGLLFFAGGDIELGQLIGKTCEWILLGGCLLAFWRTEEKWKRVLYLSVLMVLFVPKSFRYVAIYTLLPFLSWGREMRKKGDVVYAILFGLIFTIPFYGYFLPQFSARNNDGSSYILPIADLYIFLPIYLLLFWSVLQTIKERHDSNKTYLYSVNE